jgi:3-methylcrotonyl-CoA carboxylase alpha subunit
MFSAVLIANRGEIACRIIRAAHRLGLRAIAVYSDADASAPHARLADVAIRVGPAAARDSYLDGAAIIAAARAAGADCVHPGYGFLSENADFAQACADAGLAFIGPPPSAIRAMGLKDRARALMQAAGVPVTPGYHGDDQDAATLARVAGELGYPVMIKAAAGGGGRGMRRVDAAAGFDAALASARREARGAFGDDRVVIESFVAHPRHVEVQIFADAHGNVVHLFERDCSLQRRHQKVIEEAPAPGMTPAMRAALGAAATRAARAVGYVGAGTVEFIAPGGAAFGESFWFMEMNTRLQVEHPVTEAITGVDLVEWQFRVAAGEPLPMTQDQLAVNGHAVEARLYAEDPASGFLPSTGRLWALRLPAGEGVRVDAGVEQGGEVTRHYDPMIAKIIAHGANRDQALDRLSRALGETLVAGPRVNVAFLRALCDAPDFRAGSFDTGFIEAHATALGVGPRVADPRAIAFGAAAMAGRERARLFPGDGASGWDVADGFQLGGAPRVTTIGVEADGLRANVAIEWLGAEIVARCGDARETATWFEEDAFWRSADGALIAVAAADETLVIRAGVQTSLRAPTYFGATEATTGEAGAVVSPMHGKLVAIDVRVGDTVRKKQRVAVVEAMKMEHALIAPVAGRVALVAASEGAQVARGARLVMIDPTEGDVA